MVVAVTAIGILGTRSATSQGNVIAGDELDHLGGDEPAGPEHGRGVRHRRSGALRAADPAMRSRLLGSLYTSLLPAVDAQLFSLERLHAGDPPAEHADIELFIRQWTAVRNLLSPPDLTAQPAAALRRPADRRLPAGQRPP